MRTCGCANAASASISPVSGLYSSPALYCSSSSSSPRYRKMPKVLDEDNEPFKQKHLRLKKQNQCMYYISLADPWPPRGVQILSSSCSYWENLAKSYVGAPLEGWCHHLGEILNPPLHIYLLGTDCNLRLISHIVLPAFDRNFLSWSQQNNISLD